MVIFDKNKKDNFIKSKLQKQLQKQKPNTNYKNKIQKPNINIISNPQQHKNKTHNNNLTPKNHSLP
jgi:hypothetical protein